MSTRWNVKPAADPTVKRTIRCALYTRKSTEEGLEQAFSTLDAQRESAEAYVAAQRHEGWTAIATRYDDGGYSGGNMERPALARLLADIEAGLVDCVVVYKVDRLSRSLLDFSRIMSVFDEKGVSFVSVTQQFNTTHSMGRLTLNILLSFAQFEREIISERTRDKIAAARRRGKWSGGQPLLGYDIIHSSPQGSKLIVNPDEAKQVKGIFELYLQHEALIPTVQAVVAREWANKVWTTKRGVEKGGLRRGREQCDADVPAERDQDPGERGHRAGGGMSEQALTLKCAVHFRTDSKGRVELRAGKKPVAPPPPESVHVPKLARLMALAIKFDGMLARGEVKDYADIARLGHVTRARVTQVTNRLNLAPDIQEAILFLRATERGRDAVKEWEVRPLGGGRGVGEQRAAWRSGAHGDQC